MIARQIVLLAGRHAGRRTNTRIAAVTIDTSEYDSPAYVHRRRIAFAVTTDTTRALAVGVEPGLFIGRRRVIRILDTARLFTL